MATITSASHEVIAKLVPGGAQSFAQLSDDELLANTRRLVGKANHLLAALLAHLAEVETRGVHRARRCASLYTYCIYELRFSEDAAARRSAAARFAKEFPTLLHAVATGELHLTGLLMIGPHLTPHNHESVLARAKFRTKKELSKLVRDLNPLPDVQDRIEPLGPELASPLRNPTWEQLAVSLCPQIRELPVGERPCDFANDRFESTGGDAVTADTSAPDAPAADTLASDAPAADAPLADDDGLPVGPVPSDLPPVTGPQFFQMQFGTVEEHVRLVERAKALLARQRPGVTLGELHLEAMKLLVATLEKQKLGVADPSRTRTQAPPHRRQPAAESATAGISPMNLHPSGTEAPRQRGATSEVGDPSRQRGRYIPAAVRREVYERDGARCTYVDARGQRCCEAHYLELHHLQPFAKKGLNVASNLAVRCAAHNALAAEQDFGRELITERRHSTRHEAMAVHAEKSRFK